MIDRMKWINLAQGAPADERGYWRSLEGRFEISPNYRHTVYPDSYDLTDKTCVDKHRRMSFNTVKECKQHALQVLNAEIATEIGV